MNLKFIFLEMTPSPHTRAFKIKCCGCVSVPGKKILRMIFSEQFVPYFLKKGEFLVCEKNGVHVWQLGQVLD